MTYNQLWADIQEELSRLLAEELPKEPPKPEPDRLVFFQRLAVLYVRYLQVFRQLETVYDQVVHPQKRRLIRALLDGVMGRVVELKNEMVENEDDSSIMLKLIIIPIPHYFISERSKELQERSTMLADMFKVEDVDESEKVTKEMSQEEAIKIIQMAERARQGRLRAKLNQESRNMNTIYRSPGQDVIESSAICIQKVWQGYVQRKSAKIFRAEEMITLGMAMDPSYEVPRPAETTAQTNTVCTRVKQEEYEDDYQKCIAAVTEQLRDMEGDNTKQSMKDQIRQWFMECRDATGMFPEYPGVEEGGSAVLFVQKDAQQVTYDLLIFAQENHFQSRSTG
uniref:IQ motif containing with AAA domain 1 n=1 Tax=Mola mola TaxID=94237 RepID=A0A3Q4BVE1_MOLML